MFVISDCPTFLFNKVAQSKNIKIDAFYDLNIDYEKIISSYCQNSLLLISETFYKYLEFFNNEDFNYQNNISERFKYIDKVIHKLLESGTHIYIPFIPNHFIYSDRFGESFFENKSRDLFIQSINHKLFKTYSEFDNITFLKGIEKLSEKISKDYFRFSTIYDAYNSNIILDQYNQYLEKKRINKKKLIILDLDNTIWKGVLGDDSLDGISIDKSDPIGAVYRTAQIIFLDLKKRGFLLSICSKNEENLATEALFNNNKSFFKEDDFVSYKINWKPKSQNIKDICDELKISFLETIFVDDNDHECDEVKRNCRGISIFRVPKNIYKYPYQLSKSKLFDFGVKSKEDNLRTEMYKNNIKRNEIFNKIENDGNSKFNWTKSLDLELNIQRISPDNINKSRVIQLFNRTNQFNLAGSKYDDSNFNNLLINQNVFYAGIARDRIGSEGLISVIGFKFKDNSIFVNDYILSCRVFGRFIEEGMLLPLLDLAILKKCGINFNFIENKRNGVVKSFIKDISNKANFLPLSSVYKLREKFKTLPLKVIYETDVLYKNY